MGVLVGNAVGSGVGAGVVGNGVMVGIGVGPCDGLLLKTSLYSSEYEKENIWCNMSMKPIFQNS